MKLNKTSFTCQLMYYITTCIQVCNFSGLPSLYKTRCFKLQYRNGEYLRATHVYLYNSCSWKKESPILLLSLHSPPCSSLSSKFITNCDEAKIDLNQGRWNQVLAQTNNLDKIRSMGTDIMNRGKRAVIWTESMTWSFRNRKKNPESESSGQAFLWELKYCLNTTIAIFLDLNTKIYRMSKNVLYPKMQNFKNFYYNKDNRIWYFDLFKW